MSDLIDRQAVLNALKEHRSLFCDNTPETFSKLSYAEKSRVDELDTAIATIVNLPSVENKGEWIPVSERLPEKKVKDYLACCEDGYVATIMYDNGRWLINGNNVIAWMPLPEPYKAEKFETCKGCLEPCIMYEPDMRACKKKVTERGE